MRARKHALICSLCCALALLCQPLAAQELTLYTLHLPPHMIDSRLIPPKDKANQGHAVYGFDVDIVRAAFAIEGVAVHFKLMPWKRIMRDTEAGIILGAVSCRPLPSREKFAYFSDSVSRSANTLVTRKHFLDGQTPISLEMLKQYKTIAVNGWSQTNILANAAVPFMRVNGLSQGFNVLLRRNQDVFMTEQDGAIFEANRLGLLDKVSFYDVADLADQHYAVCLSKKYPEAKKWRDLLNKGLTHIKANGEWNVILKRYGLVAHDE